MAFNSLLRLLYRINHLTLTVFNSETFYLYKSLNFIDKIRKILKSNLYVFCSHQFPFTIYFMLTKAYLIRFIQNFLSSIETPYLRKTDFFYAETDSFLLIKSKTFTRKYVFADCRLQITDVFTCITF